LGSESNAPVKENFNLREPVGFLQKMDQGKIKNNRGKAHSVFPYKETIKNRESNYFNRNITSIRRIFTQAHRIFTCPIEKDFSTNNDILRW
jgi:hypothetical protein